MEKPTDDLPTPLDTKDHAAFKSLDLSSDGLRTKDGVVLVPQPSQDPEDPLACCFFPYITHSVPAEY